MKSPVVALVLLASTVSAALAGGRVAPVEPVVPGPPPPAPAFSWTGAYVGLFGALPQGSNAWAERGVNARALPGDWSGSPYGLMLGYGVQSGGLVYGAELDVAAGRLRAAGTTSPAFFCVGGTCGTEVANLASLRARIGYAVGRSLIYGTAGFARGSARATDGLGNVTGSGGVSGWTAGIGVEHAMTDRVSVRVEYLHTNLGRLELPDFCALDCFSDIRFGQLRLGAAFRF